MTDLAPWEGGTRPAKSTKAVTKPYVLPAESKLPDIYRAESADFIAASGRTVPRPPPAPRKIERNAQLALLVLAAVAVLGLLVVLFSFVMLDTQVSVIRYIYAGGGGIIALAAFVVLALELPRMSIFRTESFMPGVLVYGSRAQFEKVVGPGGIGAVLGHRARGTGAGILNKVFDRSAHAAASPEVVALHCDRGAGPELVGIEWDAVRHLRRGDIVWFRVRGISNFLMFHKLVPYAPRVVTDDATRAEIFAALKVGKRMFKDKPIVKNMGTTKVLNKDADGKIVPGPAQLEVPPSGGTLLGGEEQPFQGKGQDDEPEALGPTGTHIYDADDFSQSGDTEKVQKPWAEDA